MLSFFGNQIGPIEMTAELPPGIHRVKSRSASGETVEYHRLGRGKGAQTFWKSTDGTPLGGEKYLKAYRRAVRKEKPSSGKFREIILTYLESPKFSRLKPRTQSDYRKIISHKNGIDAEFGDAPIRAFEDPRIRRRVIKWRDAKWRHSPRQADAQVSVLRAMVFWATNNGLLLHHHLQNIESLYTSNRAEIVWTDNEIRQFCQDPVPRYVQRILIVVAETGLAPVDAVRLQKTKHVKQTPLGRRIEMRRAKTGILSSMPVTGPMDEVLDEMPLSQDHVLVNANGKPWSPSSSLGSYIRKWRLEIGLPPSVTLYDARGYAATRLLNCGANLSEISLAMGWSFETTSKMIEVYARVDPSRTDGTLRKLNSLKIGNKSFT